MEFEDFQNFNVSEMKFCDFYDFIKSRMEFKTKIVFRDSTVGI